MDTNTFTITVSWPTLHDLFTRIDDRRRPLGLGRFELFYDVFGGTYRADHYERKGLPGLIELSNGLDRLAREVWDFIHKLNAELPRIGCTRERAIKTARGYCRVATAVAAAKLYLHQIGLRRDPAAEICGTGDDMLTGLRWLAGAAEDRGAGLDEVSAFAATGDISPLATIKK
jgi:hypothetical protein